LMKLVILLLLLKKVLISAAKCVLSWTDSVTSTVIKQSTYAVTTNEMVLFV